MIAKNKKLFLVWCLFLVAGIILNASIARWNDIVWLLTVTILLFFILKLDESLLDSISTIESQDEYIKELLSTDDRKTIGRLTSEVDRSSMNCYHYLRRIIQLKEEIAQLKTLNKNLIETKFKGKCYGNKNPNRRANQKGDK